MSIQNTDSFVLERAGTIYKTAGSTITDLVKAGGDLVEVVDIVDSVVSTAVDSPLSANQGKLLDEKIDDLNFATSATYNSGTETVTITNKDSSTHLWDLSTLVNASAGKGVNQKRYVVASSTVRSGTSTSPIFTDGTSQVYARVFPTSKVYVTVTLQVKKTTTTNNFTNNNVVTYARAWARDNAVPATHYCTVEGYTKYGCSGRTSGTEEWVDFFSGTTFIEIGDGSGSVTIDFGMTNPTLTGLGTNTVSSQIWSANGSSSILFTEIET